MDFRILGPLEVADDGSRVALGKGKQRALLALLLLHANEVVSIDRLVDELWGERPPPTAQTGLHGYVSQLRKLLGSERVETRGSGYLLRVDDGEVDSERFESLARAGDFLEALAVWRGPALADFAYEPWAQAEIARLEELRVACLERRIDSDLRVGRTAELVGELEALVAAHPLRERFRAQLMLALYRAGRQGEALQAYQNTRRTLSEDLGLEPGPALQELQKAILTQDPSLELGPSAGLDQPPSTEPEAGIVTGTVTFLFTDIEGSTRLMSSLGDDYAVVLEAHHRLLRETFGARDGQEIDSQGDAFFFAFRRARDAAAAAVDAQRALAAETWPAGVEVRVRMGIHTGEPGLAASGYHGLDVVCAARIAAAAHGGQIVVSSTTRDLVGDGRIPEVSFRDLGEHRLKDLGRPQRLFQAVAPGVSDQFPALKTTEGGAALDVAGREEELVAAAHAAVGAEEARRRRPRDPRLLLAAAALVLAAAAALAAWLVSGGNGSAPTVIANSLVRIDPKANEIVEVVPVGGSPVALATVGQYLWVANRRDDTLTRIDTRSLETRTFAAPEYPLSLAAEGPRIWVGSESSDELVVIDGETGSRLERLPVNLEPAGFVAYSEGSLWVSHGVFSPGFQPDAETAVSRIDVLAREVTTTPLKVGDLATWIAVGHGAAWVSLTGPGELLRIDARNGKQQRIRVGSAPLGVAVGFGKVWVVSANDDEVRRVNAATGNVERVVDVGNQPLGVAAGAGSVWVANNRDRTVSRIDPATGDVVATIRMDYFPVAVHVADGAVWVTVSGEPAFDGSSVFG